jgi:hypothetical protein
MPFAQTPIQGAEDCVRCIARTSLGLLTLGALASACSGTTLVGGGKPKDDPDTPPVETQAHAVAGKCGDASEHEIVLASDADTITVSGELCPKLTTVGLHVTLLVDTSKSMRVADPQLEGSCQRLVAARKLVDTLRAQATNPAGIHLSVVHFAVATTVAHRDVTLDGADAITNVETFCAGETSDTGFTNYAAAFAALPELMLESDVTRTAYLITDGVPTTGGDAAPGFVADADESKRRLQIHGEAARAALFAANAAADARPWAVNALFFGGKTDFSAYAFDPAAFLASLTGTASRVAVVGDAAGLPDAITTLPFGMPGLELAKASVTVVADGAPAPATLRALVPDPTGGLWRFDLDPLAASSGDALTVTVTAPDAAGGTATATVKIAVKQP